MSDTAAPVLRKRRDHVGVTRPVQNERGDFGRADALGLREPCDVFAGWQIEIDQVLRIAGPDGDLLHVDVGRIEQRAAFRHRHGGDRARHVLGAERGALEWIDRDVDLRPRSDPDILADEQHGRFVALALADHHRSVDRQLAELAPHGVNRGLVGVLLVAAPAQARRRHRGALGHAHDLDREDAIQHPFGLRCGRRHFLSSPWTNPVLQAGRQFFSIRITCGMPEITLSRPTAASALRTASSVVA